MLRSEAKRALDAAADFLAELVEYQAEARFAEDGEFTDSSEFADATLNNLPAIAYALNSGLPVIEWGPAQKNPTSTERVLRAMRQWNEQARLLLVRLANGDISVDQFYFSLQAAYVQHSTNAYVAGRRAIGNLAPLSDEDLTALDARLSPDVTRLAQTQTDTEEGGLGSFLMSMLLDPTNFFGSGLPGDPFAPHGPEGVAGGAAAAKGLNSFMRRMDQYGRTIGSYASLGELEGLSGMIPPDGTLVWWELGAADHCIDCIAMSDMSPYYASTLLGGPDAIYPGAGYTRCGSNCQCSLQYDLPTTVCGDPFTGPGLADFGVEVGPMDPNLAAEVLMSEANREAIAGVRL